MPRMKIAFGLACRVSVFAVLALTVVGCSSGGVSPVSGTVKFKSGKVLPYGTVMMEVVQPNGRRLNSRGEIGPDGNYKMNTWDVGQGAVLGLNRVIVLPAAGVAEPAVPEKYWDFKTSGLEFKVEESGKNQYDITLDDSK